MPSSSQKTWKRPSNGNWKKTGCTVVSLVCVHVLVFHSMGSSRIVQTALGLVYVRAIMRADHLYGPRNTANLRMAPPKLTISLSTPIPLANPGIPAVVGYVCPNPPAARSSLHLVVASPTPRHRLASSHLLTRVARKPLTPRVPCIVACPSRYG